MKIYLHFVIFLIIIFSARRSSSNIFLKGICETILRQFRRKHRFFFWCPLFVSHSSTCRCHSSDRKCCVSIS